MKKLFIIGLLLIFLLAVGVSAVVQVNPSSLTVSNKKPKESFSTSFNVNSSENLTGLTLSQPGLSDFSINFTVGGVPGSTFSLTAGVPKTVVVNGKIPEDVNTRLSPFSGTITIGGSISPVDVSLSIEVESQLDLSSLKFVVDGTSKSMSNGDTRKDVMPGSKLEIKGDVENLFTDDDDITIEDITVEITIDGIDDGDDLEESVDVGDINADEKEGFSVDFEIPGDIDAEEYDVEILVEGDDENGAEHSIRWEVKVQVEKDNHDIQIRDVAISPSSIDCSRTIGINVDLKNQGENDEDEVVVKIESATLGINQEDTSIPEIEEGTGDDTEYSKTYPFTIGDKVKAGTYQIIVRAYYDTDTLSDSETVSLIVGSCEAEEETPPEEVVVVTPPKTETGEEEEEGPEIITGAVTETTEQVSFLGSNTYLIFLAVAVGVAVIVIIIMIAILFATRKRV